MLGLSPSGAQKIQGAWERAVVDSATEVLRHLPLVCAGVAIAVLQVARDILLPGDGRPWTIGVDLTLVAIAAR